MATWLNTLRKRHAKQYASMQLQAREAQYFKERKLGYKDSLNSDKEREEREAVEEAERIAKAKAEKKRLAAIAKRREEISVSMPKEPEAGGSVKTISIRLMDGRSTRRRFSADNTLADVFNWADVTFELEREAFELTTMNGKSTFLYETDRETTLEDSGLGKMAGLRLVDKKEEKVDKESDRES